jgi:hypothetical protein
LRYLTYIRRGTRQQVEVAEPHVQILDHRRDGQIQYRVICNLYIPARGKYIPQAVETWGAGSWRVMYLTQPPCAVRFIIFEPIGSRRIAQGQRTIVRECTMDGMLEVLAEVPIDLAL